MGIEAAVLGPLIGGAIGGGTSIASSLIGRNGIKDAQNATNAQMQPLIDYQKRLYAMTDPAAASMFNMAPPEGSVPMRQAMLQAAYAMMPAFSKTGLAQGPVDYSQTNAVPRTGWGGAVKGGVRRMQQ